MPLHGVVGHVPVTAEDLNGLVRAEGRSLGRHQLCHSGLLDEVLLVVLELRRAPVEKAGRLDLHGHVGKLELDALELGDGRVERHA